MKPPKGANPIAWAREQAQDFIKMPAATEGITTIDPPTEEDYLRYLRDDAVLNELLRINGNRYMPQPSDLAGISTGPADEAYTYWSKIVSALDTTEFRSPDANHIAIEVTCPRCSKRLVTLGLDRVPHPQYDSVWFRPRRRVEITWRGVDESYAEGYYFAHHRMDVPCPVPGCRGKIEWRIPNIVLTLHRLRAAHADDPRERIVVERSV